MDKLQNESQFTEIIAGVIPTVVVFKADWCKDCHFIDPFMPELIEKYEGQLHFIEVDRDTFPDLCETYMIMGIPSFVAFKESKEIVRFVSKFQKSKDEIDLFFERAAAVGQAL